MATDPGGPVHVGIAVFRSGSRVWVVQRFMRCECRNDELASRLRTQRRDALAFAEALHRDLLGTTATAPGRELLAAPLAYGVSRTSIAWLLAHSDRWVGAIVDRLYRSTLGRDPDPAGLEHWLREIVGGRSPADVAAHFFASPEYLAAVGGTHRAWVEALYAALLGRTGDRLGIDHWVARLAFGASRHAVALDLYQSAESRRRRVEGLYQLLLGRAPDPAGLSHWIARLADGQDVRLAVELAGSREYLTRAVARFS